MISVLKMVGLLFSAGTTCRPVEVRMARETSRQRWSPWSMWGSCFRRTTHPVRSLGRYKPPHAERLRVRVTAELPPRLQPESQPAVGIDLGTTSSVVAVIQEGKPAVLADDLGRKTMPSIVSLSAQGKDLPFKLCTVRCCVVGSSTCLEGSTAT